MSHTDLNPSNILVDPNTYLVSAVLDWERAQYESPVRPVWKFFLRSRVQMALSLMTVQKQCCVGHSARICRDRSASSLTLIG